jgi:hypothetical protein
MSTGKHLAEVLADRLESDDPEFDDCADAAAMLRTIPELEAEIEGLTSTVIRQGEILRAVVVAVRGAPPENTSWSSHDAAELVRDVVAERDALRQALRDISANTTDAYAFETASQALDAPQAVPAAQADAGPVGIARRKRDGLLANGYTVTGWVLSKPGERHAVMHCAAVRWLTNDSLWTLMHVNGSTVVAPAQSANPVAQPLHERLQNPAARLEQTAPAGCRQNNWIKP